jgi:uncharacterized phiE125 gp8 family phage protein
MNDDIRTLVTGPSAEPVSLDETKAHLRVGATDEDGLIIGKIIAARMMAEAWLGRALITQTWDWFLPCFPSDGYGGTFYVPYPPLQSVTHVKYVDENGDEQTISSANYAVIAPAGPRASPGTIRPAYNVDWPSYRAQPDAVRIRFVAGWTGPEKVPDPIRSAIKLIVGDLYENREAQIADARAIIQANKTVDALLLPFQTHISGLRAA